jgi:GNAT superfamily N-acetyltransferase
MLMAFLHKVYPPLKSTFLNEHGGWWHGSDANRLIIQDDGQIAGYCGVIPTQSWIAGQVHSALWWVDVMIAPEFRGRGLQSIFDQRIKEMAPLLLGFPNELAAKIHRKHGWGVREDMPILMLPLRPRDVKLVRNTGGRRGMFMRAGVWMLGPLAAIWRAIFAARRSAHIRKLDVLNPKLLSEIFLRTKSGTFNTTWRDESYFAWRYGSAPFQVSIVITSPGDRITHII